MAGAVVNYPLVAGLIAFAIAQSTKFFTTWDNDLKLIWFSDLSMVFLDAQRTSADITTWTMHFSIVKVPSLKELPTELFDNAEDVDFFEADACPVDKEILWGYMTRRTSMFSQCQKLIRYVRGATNRCNRLIGKKQIKGEAKRLDYILLCVWRGLRRHQPLFRGSFHQEILDEPDMSQAKVREKKPRSRVQKQDASPAAAADSVPHKTDDIAWSQTQTAQTRDCQAADDIAWSQM